MNAITWGKFFYLFLILIYSTILGNPQSHGYFFFITKSSTVTSCSATHGTVKSSITLKRRLWFAEHLPLRKGNFHIPIFIPDSLASLKRLPASLTPQVTIGAISVSVQPLKSNTMPSISCPQGMVVRWFMVRQSDMMKACVQKIKGMTFLNDTLYQKRKRKREAYLKMKREYALLQFETNPQIDMTITYDQHYFSLNKEEYFFYLPLLTGNIGGQKGCHTFTVHHTPQISVQLDNPQTRLDKPKTKNLTIIPKDFVPVILIITPKCPKQKTTDQT